MSLVALIDYGSGNLHSAGRALREAARLANTGHEIRITHAPDDILAAERVVLPGVGHFADCAAGLRAQPGVIAALETACLHGDTPFLGICVGMQLLAETGREDGATPGLGWIGGEVTRIQPGDGFRVPHMGWNGLDLAGAPHPVLAGLGVQPHVYFTHSYALHVADPADIAATAGYGAQAITAAVARDNLFGTQFHPEKSQGTGLRILSNFLQWTP
ncbi:MAG: imidazole glycerol phosphate synthase subunit HisH [Hyphomonas sp.]|nr:imidazole glycerol phosphate synthase subunit HisH [Hyphomonas sp.]